MRKHYFKVMTLATTFAFAAFQATAQSPDEVLNLMINKGIISQTDADSLRAEAAIKGQEAKEKQKSFNITSSRFLQLSGYTQIRYQNNDQVSLTDGTGSVDGLYLRRVRLDARGSIFPIWDYRLQLDFATSPKILDAYMTYKPRECFKVQAGQFKVPFSLENITQSNKMELIDRSQVVEALVARGKDVIGNHNGRDLGLMVFGSLLKIKDRYIIDYYVGGFDGQGINVVDKNNSKDIAGRLIFHPITGLNIGGSYYNGYDNITSGTTSVNRKRQRFGAELSYTWKNLGIKSEFIDGFDGIAPVAGKNDFTERQGYYVQASYFFKPKKFQLVAKYDTYEANISAPATGKADDVSTWYVFGANYFFNDWAKIQVNWTAKGGNIEKIMPTELTKRQKANDLVSVQVQIGF